MFHHILFYQGKLTFFHQKFLPIFFLTWNFFHQQTVFTNATESVTKFNLNCDTTKKLKFWSFKNSIEPKLKNPNCDKSLKRNRNCNKFQNSICDKTQIAIKLNLNSNKTQSLKFWQLNFEHNLKQSFGKNNLTPWQPMRGPHCSVLRSRHGYRTFETLQYNGILNPKLSDEMRKILRHFAKVSKI